MQVLRKILFPVSIVYAFVVHLRNYFYDKGFFSSKSYRTPTVCIGNLSVGGTGKTPMIEFLISKLKSDYKVAILSRGYMRKSKGFILANDNSSVEDIGDEPFQIFNKFSEVVVAVDANRQNGIEHLERECSPDIILLDDAYQHRKVKSDFYILLTAFDNLYVNDWYLPTGDLRDAKSQADRAHTIVVTKCPSDLTLQKRKEIIEKLKLKAYQQVLFSFLAYSKMIVGHESECPLNDLIGKKVTLVTGIANPRPLTSYLEEMGLSFEHLKYKDHHFFTSAELEMLAQKEFVLTTEKDYVRLKNNLSNVHYIAVAHKFFDDGEQLLLEGLKKIM
ncbi:tetraacyldisaccharide 4'-kinase [Pseudozobellia sp. WGM2]|uniref:tetraacyldisaccharide 4'-kinase n=1 Tax=Pseudozobellia sp. WGM2 TaxID=2787625 RepID=UPI001ADF45FE|nr:tetraacyldisaccharide 4'-kinase [Pseudozobellia sp. WGM2]